jgi:hypothetical protein
MKAYLQHSFADLDANQMLRATNKKGVPKTSKKDDKGKLPTNHPLIEFLADLCHIART